MGRFDHASFLHRSLGQSRIASHQLGLAVEEIPEEGAFEGAIFEMEIAEGAVVTLEFQVERIERRHEHTSEEFDRLSQRLFEE